MTLQTGIAVALAIIVVGSVFIFPGISPLRFLSANSAPTETASTSAAAAAVGDGSGDQAAPATFEVTDVQVGTGQEVKAGDTIEANYVGMFANGQVFDASANHGGPAEFQIGVGKVIPGWDKGIVGMKVGGKRHLVIPGDLGYGPNGYPGVIPPNATLIFDVEVVGIKGAK